MAPLKPLLFTPASHAVTIDSLWKPVKCDDPQSRSCDAKPGAAGEVASGTNDAPRPAVKTLPEAAGSKKGSSNLLGKWQATQKAAPLQLVHPPLARCRDAAQLLLPDLRLTKASRTLPHSKTQSVATAPLRKAIVSLPDSPPVGLTGDAVTGKSTKSQVHAGATSPDHAKEINDRSTSERSSPSGSLPSSSLDVSSEWVPSTDEDRPVRKRQTAKKARSQPAQPRAAVTQALVRSALHDAPVQPLQLQVAGQQLSTAAEQTHAQACKRDMKACLPVLTTEQQFAAACAPVEVACMTRADVSNADTRAKIKAKVASLPRAKLTHIAHEHEVPVLLGAPATLRKASEKLVLVEIPSTFDVDGDAGVIGRVCKPLGAIIAAPQLGYQHCSSQPIWQADSDSSSIDGGVHEQQATTKAALTYKVSATGALGIKQADEQAVGPAMVLDLKGELYGLSCLPLHSTALLAHVKTTAAGQVCEIQATFNCAHTTMLISDPATGVATAYGHDFDDDEDERVYNFSGVEAGDEGALDSPAKLNGSKKQRKTAAVGKSRPRSSKASKKVTKAKKPGSRRTGIQRQRASRPSTVKHVGAKRATGKKPAEDAAHAAAGTAFLQHDGHKKARTQ